MPKFDRRKLLLAKVEGTYGSDAAPTAALNAILAEGFDHSPMEGEDYQRKFVSPFLGARGTIPLGLHQKLKFSVEATPSGVPGTPPAWDPLLRACGCARTIVANTSVAYTRVSDNHEAVTIHANWDGLRFRPLGARGNAKFRWDANSGPMLDFDFTGLFTDPEDVAMPSLASLADQIANVPQPVSSATVPTFTVDGVSLAMRSLSLDLGNTVEPRFIVRSEGAIISDSREVVEFQTEATPLSVFNPYQLAKGAVVPFAFTHGVGAGKITTLSVPRLQLMRPGGITAEQGIMEHVLRGSPLFNAGNDQFTLTLT